MSLEQALADNTAALKALTVALASPQPTVAPVPPAPPVLSTVVAPPPPTAHVAPPVTSPEPTNVFAQAAATSVAPATPVAPPIAAPVPSGNVDAKGLPWDGRIHASSKALVADGMTFDKFRVELRREIVLSRLREREVENRISVSENEIDLYLEDQASSKEVSGEYDLSHILVRVPEQATPDQLMRIGARAQAALAQIRRGEDFAKISASYSDAPDALTGGAMGARPLERLPALYADAVKKLKPGETSDILRSPAGFHIVKLIEQRGGAGPKAGVALKQSRARHILIKVNELVSEAEARRRLVTLKERLDNGADFAELARLHSNDLSAAKGGELGWLYQGDTVPDFEKAMDALKINQISEPVQSPFGFHLIQVLERRTEDATAERQRLTARQVLRDRKSDEAYQDWVRQMRDRAYVEYRSEER